MLKYTPCCFKLGFHLPKVHSKSLRELKISALVDHDFIVVVLLNSLDEPVSGFDELFVLCRSSCKSSEFTQWPPVMYPLRMRTQCVTAEHLKMTVVCEFWSQAFSQFSNVDTCTFKCPDEQQTH